MSPTHAPTVAWTSTPTSLVRTAEPGTFDMVFLSARAGVRTTCRDAEELSRQGGRTVRFEPLTLLSAPAVHTTHAGLTATQTPDQAQT
ncbi:hypothetical protein ACFXKI_09015 [Streptomyces mirabilis]|uniref:hypothetical protein n=1 Tax=Streptomyces mirabilis TaxID=68239 RepID=UPI0036ACF460